MVRVHFVNGDYLTGEVGTGRDEAGYVEGVLSMGAPLGLRTVLRRWVMIPASAILYVQEMDPAATEDEVTQLRVRLT